MSWLKRIYRQWWIQRAVAKLAGTRVLAEMARAQPEARFVQVGANDGKMMDPLRKTLFKSQWRGLVVEPVPELFLQLKSNYQAIADRVVPVNVAIAADNGQSSFYHLQNKADLSPLPDWAAGLGSFRKDVILAHASRLPDIERYIAEIQVPCLTWEALCRHHQLPQVDLVLIDTEGYDYEIIRQIDFQRSKPVVLIYEHHHFDGDTDRECTALLSSNGYILFREGLDTWAIDSTNSDGRFTRLINRLPEWVNSSAYAQSWG